MPDVGAPVVKNGLSTIKIRRPFHQGGPYYAWVWGKLDRVGVMDGLYVAIHPSNKLHLSFPIGKDTTTGKNRFSVSLPDILDQVGVALEPIWPKLKEAADTAPLGTNTGYPTATEVVF